MNINSLITKDYRKKDDFVVRINKPNSNPILKEAKMNANVFVTKDYENETTLRPQKNKPNSNPVLSAVEWANFKRRTYSLTGRSGFYIMILNRIINKAFAEVTGAWWCPWSSKPVWG